MPQTLTARRRRRVIGLAGLSELGAGHCVLTGDTVSSGPRTPEWPRCAKETNSQDQASSRLATAMDLGAEERKPLFIVCSLTPRAQLNPLPRSPASARLERSGIQHAAERHLLVTGRRHTLSLRDNAA
jgi:hypothetical protein